MSKGKSGPLSAYMKMIDEKKVERCGYFCRCYGGELPKKLTIFVHVRHILRRNEKQIAALAKLQTLHEAVVDFDTNPSKYTEVCELVSVCYD